ncbi:MAG TPA: HAMP domain-containing sensor histidine kinase [Kribbella sp.]
MSLFWRIFALNALVLGAATALLLWAPVTVSVPVLLTEAVVLIGGLAVMLVANAALLRVGLAPLARLNRQMSKVDVLRPGQRLPVRGHGGVPDLLRAFNDMLDRLEQERATSAARALSAQESERRRIARELHDEVGQTLTAVLMDLKRAADRAPDDGLRDELAQAQETARASLDEVRRLAHRLRPGVLEDLGLTSALTALADEISDHTGLEIRRRFDSGLQLDEQAELVLYRVAQESLTNVARHAGATRIDLSLAQAGASVVLRIADDGRGMGQAHEGAGIRGMRERALLIGASLELQDDSSGGAAVVLTVPSNRAVGGDGL